MAFSAPNLDDRKFQQIVDEAKKRIKDYCPEWSDHNVSDPGVTLLELFAWMMDMLLHRMNQIPDLHYFKFLEFLGIQRQLPKPAQAKVTFWLTKAQANLDPIPAGTEVSTTQTETQPALIYTTEREFIIQTPVLKALITRDSNRQTRTTIIAQQGNDELLPAEGINAFASEPPRQDDTLYLGFLNDLSDHVLQLDMVVDQIRAAGGGLRNPPYEWHVQNEEGWAVCEAEDDNTQNLNKNGWIKLHLPTMQQFSLEGHNLYWLRLRLRDAKYTELSPRLRALTVTAIGAAISVIHASPSQIDEEIGVSNGLADQRFRLQHTLVLARRPGENLRVIVDGVAEDWQEVADFADSTRADCHYTLDSQSGELRLGPALRLTNGQIKQFAQIPPVNAILRFTRYHYLDGLVGNVKKGQINTLKSSISYVDRVENRRAASGGQAAESPDELRLRVSKLLRTSNRAVTAADYVELARDEFNRLQPAPLVAQVKCLTVREKSALLTPELIKLLQAKLAPGPELVALLQQNSAAATQLAELLQTQGGLEPELTELYRQQGSFAPDLVELFVVPQLDQEDAEYLRPSPAKLQRAFAALHSTLAAFLNQRALLTTRLQLSSPTYQYVVVHVSLNPPSQDKELWSLLEQRTLNKLYRFIHPVEGGRAGCGWPFGLGLHIGDIYECLQTGANALSANQIRQVRLFAGDASGAARGRALDEIKVDPLTVLISGQHVPRVGEK